MTLLSAPQCRAARALVGWSQDDLANASGVAKATIAYFETEKRQPYDKTLGDLRRVLEKNGVAFIDMDDAGAGVRLRDRKR